jgi:hypothetical protein
MGLAVRPPATLVAEKRDRDNTWGDLFVAVVAFG